MKSASEDQELETGLETRPDLEAEHDAGWMPVGTTCSEGSGTTFGRISKFRLSQEFVIALLLKENMGW